jgi:hypothetical protein
MNVRVMYHSTEGIQDQNVMWARLNKLHTSVVALSDVALQDCTVKEPQASLFKSVQIASQQWGPSRSAGLTATHSQGCPDIMREVVGGTLLVTDSVVSALLGKALNGVNNFGRCVGRRLVGSRKRSILRYEVYFPTYANESKPGSAWQTQLRLMRLRPIKDQAADPWHQALADLTMQIISDITSQSVDTVRFTRIICSGDWNANWVIGDGSETA